MSLTIRDTILDEEIRTPATGTDDEHDTSATSSILNAISAATVPGDFGTSPTGFPQFAERTSFVSSTNPVTNYFLGDADGDPLVGVATTLYVGSNQVFLYSTSDPNIVVGRIGSGTTADATGDVAIVIAVEETVTSGFVTSADMWLGLYYPLVQDGENLLDSADELNLDGLIYLGSDYDTTTMVPFENFNGVPSGNNLFNVIFPSDGTSAVELLLTGSAGETLKTVNVSTTGIGAGSQHIDVGASLRIDTVNGMTQANVDSAPEVNQAGNIDYTNRVEIVAADFEITQLNPGSANERVDIRVSAFNAAGTAQEGSYLTDAIASDGVAVTIDVADIIVLNGAGQDITSTLTITQDGDSVIIRGLDDGANADKTDGYQVFFSTDGVRFDRFIVTNIDSSTTFDVGNIHVTAVQGGSDTEFEELGSHLRYQDDGPLLTASGATVAALTADESALATNPSGSFAGLFNSPDAGADAPASIAYTLGVSSSGALSGLTDTASGDAVYLFLGTDGKVVGRAGDTAALAQSGPIVFEVSVSALGTITLDQQRAVFHTDSNDHNSTTAALTASLITLTATASDSEPDATDDSAAVTVSIGDHFLFRDDGPSISVSSDVSAPNDLVVQNLPNVAAGTDSSSYGLTPGADGLKSFSIIGPADSSGLFQWSYVTGTTDSIVGTYDGSALYTLDLNPDGTYTFDMTGSLPSSTLDLDVNDIKAGGPNSNSIQVGVLGTDPRFVEIAATGGPINESNDNVGVTNGNFDTGEGLTFKLYDGTTELSFLGLNIGTKSASGGTYHFSATPTAGGTAITGTLTVDKNGTIEIDTGGVLVNSITLTKVSGSTTKIGLDDIDILLPPDDAVLSFDVRLTDGDNDFVDQSFTVSIDGNNDGYITDPVSASSFATAADIQSSSFLSDPQVFDHQYRYDPMLL